MTKANQLKSVAHSKKYIFTIIVIIFVDNCQMLPCQKYGAYIVMTYSLFPEECGKIKYTHPFLILFR